MPSPDVYTVTAAGPPAVAPSENGRSPAPAPRRLASIVGLGRALPRRVIDNAEIAAGLAGIDEEWIVRRTGIRSRHRAGEGEGVVSLALEASRAALAETRVAPGDLDFVLVATVGPDEMLPNAAPLLAAELGATPAAAMDLGAACSGSLYGLATAAALIESGRADNVLVVGVEVLSRFLDPADRRVLPLFGDGAGAMVLSSGGAGGLGPIVLHADGALGHYIHMTRADRLVRMEGHETFIAAVTHLSAVTEEALAAAGVSVEEIDLFVYHQANSRILTSVAERLKLPAERVLDCIAATANTSAASLPLALCEARERGLLAPGRRVLLGVAGAGFTWGAGVMEWGDA